MKPSVSLSELKKPWKQHLWRKKGSMSSSRLSFFKEQSFNHILSIQHKIISSIPSVGLQVWRAALVLADFILHKVSTSSDFDGISSLELGAGTGYLLSLVTAGATGLCFMDCVRFGQYSIGILRKDRDLNGMSIMQTLAQKYWTTVYSMLMSTPMCSNIKKILFVYKYSWTSSDIKEAEESSIILAADVIYMDDLTNSLFNILEKLMSCGSEKVLYLALEKRYNFSLNDLDVVANGYSHFKIYLKSEEECKALLECGSSCFVGKLINLDEVPKYVRECERGEDLEIWQIMYRCSRNS
ncbi:hypothetical protein QJS10_CPB17g02380 [Acorus calamus]|uniref:Methyltransferase-like protein 22 n=1 Tax=Acorus calamus TaxID=4465 RepID=A0AAV9CYW9_ACOCL|nr:hypothetical protein QJS10_CPB17g02380 [Acorus calamus]